jgi:hypothetical protein
MHPSSEDALRWARMLRPDYCIPCAEFVWDGAPPSAVSLPRDGKVDLSELFDQHWNERGLAAGCRKPADDAGLAKWKRGLEALRADPAVNLLMLHPLQGVRFT